MRVVTMKDLRRLEAVMNRISDLSLRSAAAAAAAARDTDTLVSQGDIDEANSSGSEEIARLSLVMSNIAAEVEIAAVAFLGERRGPGEALNAYLARIHAACQDLGTVVATQRANGLEYRP